MNKIRYDAQACPQYNDWNHIKEKKSVEFDLQTRKAWLCSTLARVKSSHVTLQSQANAFITYPL